MDEFSYSDSVVDNIARHFVEQKGAGLTGSDAPVGTVLGGLPGAGKSTLLNTFREEQHGNVLVVNADEFRRFHPQFNDIVDKYGENYPEHTAAFSGAVAERVIALGTEKRLNLAVEGTFRTAQTPISTLQLLKDNGYTTQVYIKAESAEVAWNNTLARAEAERAMNGTGRTVSRAHFDTVVAQMPDNVDTVYQSGLADSMKVFTASEMIFDSNEPENSPEKLSSLIAAIQNAPVPEGSAPVQPRPDAENNAGATPQAEMNGFSFAASEDRDAAPEERLDLAALMTQLTHERHGNAVRYLLAGVPAFEDHRSGIYMASEDAAMSKEMVLVALQTAAVNYGGSFTVTGSEDFKQRVYGLIAEYDLKVSLNDPAQREALSAVQQAHLAQERATSHARTAEVQPQPANAPDTSPQAGQSVAPDAPVARNGVEPAAEASSAEERKPVLRGELLDFGRAKYEHKDDEKMSYFIKLRNEHGEKEHWGVDFQRALKDAGVKRGDIITASFVGNKDVEVNAPVRDENGKIVRYEKIITQRNEWKVAAEYPKPTTENPTAARPDTFAAYDALTYRQLRDEVQAMVLERQPTARFSSHDPAGETLWFFANGKPVPESVEKPAIAELSSLNRLSGAVVFVQDSQNPSAACDALFVASRDGYMQGVIRNPQTDTYDHVIARQVTQEKDGQTKSYFTLSCVQEQGLKMLGYGHVSPDGETLVYKLQRSEQLQPLTIANKDIKAMPGFAELFKNAPKPPKPLPNQPEQVKRHEQNATAQPMPSPKM
ncbi:TPA: hypothetical protein I8Y16_004020 [Raoultella ornithinolytica]|nr:hypothetical protein [Raoultella ornithinolytica]HAT1670165.1 hypothetical protein [Raoultella ornithinolytica]